MQSAHDQRIEIELRDVDPAADRIVAAKRNVDRTPCNSPVDIAESTCKVRLEPSELDTVSKLPIDFVAQGRSTRRSEPCSFGANRGPSPSK